MSDLSPKQKAKNKRLLKKFNITLERQDAMRAEQNGLCLICGGLLDAHGPAGTDHFHFKVKAFRHTMPFLSKWYAHSYDELGRVVFVQHAKTKEAAIEAVKALALPWSVRGLLCFKCNYGLGCIERFFDAAAHPENLLPVIDYLRKRLDNPTK